MKKTALITGITGQDGSYLAELLLEKGYEVYGLFRRGSTNTAERIEHLLKEREAKGDGLHLVYGDMTDSMNLVRLMLEIKPDEIYNLACPASPVHYQHDPVQTIKTCVNGATNMLGLAKRCGARIYQASTSEVYGDPDVHPQTEDYWGHVNPNGIRSCYDEGKRCAEAMFFSYWRQHHLPIKVGRIFNTYGPKMLPNDGRVVSNFIVQALQNHPISIYGDGSQTRSFCYVDDLIECMVRFMASPEDFVGPMNMGNPGEFTIKELAEKIIDLTGSSSKIVYEPLPGDDPKQRRPNIDLARKMLGWEPRVKLDDGLKKTIPYFEKLLKDGMLKGC